jgi:hypothetical protein
MADCQPRNGNRGIWQTKNAFDDFENVGVMKIIEDWMDATGTMWGKVENFRYGG